MNTSIFEIIKNNKLLRTYTRDDVTINKDSVEKMIKELTGLQQIHYDVSYIDHEDDKIMTISQQDYQLAELTIQDNLIRFYVEVKLEEKDITFKSEQKQAKKQEGREEISSQGTRVRDVVQDQKQIKEEKSEKEEKIMQAQKIEKNQKVQVQDFSNISDTSSQKIEGEILLSIKQKQSIEPIPAARSLQPQQKEQVVNAGSETLYYKLKQEVLDQLKLLLNDKIQQLSMKQKPAQQAQPIKLFNCHICKSIRVKIPFYINELNQLICQQCQKDYDSDEILVKVRNQKSTKGLLAVKIFPVYESDISVEQGESQDLKKAINGHILEKVNSESE